VVELPSGSGQGWDLPGGGLWPVGLGSEVMGEKTAAGGTFGPGLFHF
jgi:hypothetical protein